MNKISLLIVSLFFLANNANATTNNRFSKENKTEMNHYGANPISFIENGIAFYVFPDGQFDFDTPTVQRVVYTNHGRRNANINCHISGINVIYDYYGRIIRIGNVPLAYDKINRIKRIGSVWMDYNYYGLTNVGGLQIIYNNYNQIINMAGSVNTHCGGNNYPDYGPNYGYNDNQYDSNHGNHSNDKDDFKHNNGNHENHSDQGHGNGNNKRDRDERGNRESQSQGRR